MWGGGGALGERLGRCRTRRGLVGLRQGGRRRRAGAVRACVRPPGLGAACMGAPEGVGWSLSCVGGLWEGLSGGLLGRRAGGMSVPQTPNRPHTPTQRTAGGGGSAAGADDVPLAFRHTLPGPLMATPVGWG